MTELVAKVGVNFNYVFKKIGKGLLDWCERQGQARAKMCLQRSGYRLEDIENIKRTGRW
mgnify:CR=1 FL=1